MIEMSEYAARRLALLEKVKPNSVIILAAAPEVYRNNDAAYAYRQHSDFYYLTGFKEQEAVMVLCNHGEQQQYILFNRERNLQKEIWDGKRAGQAGACSDYLADRAYPIHALADELPRLLAGNTHIYYPIGKDCVLEQQIMQALNTLRAEVRDGGQWPETFIDILPLLHEMRLFKSSAEIALMQKAADISAAAHVRAMRACAVGKFEYELEAELTYEFMRQGARAVAYTSIVGSGAHSCILHYVANDAKMVSGDIVLIDAAAEYQYYAADITRTFPVNGQFSIEQRAIYALVLKSQLAAIATIKPGTLFSEPQEVIVRILTQGLIELGILSGDLQELLEAKAYAPFYMHRSGHWLGLDVHDAGQYRSNDSWRPFAAGMVLTVEPGLYISADMANVDERWHNIGVRIEDDIVVTEEGCHVLTSGVPKEIAAIEALMAQ